MNSSNLTSDAPWPSLCALPVCTKKSISSRGIFFRTTILLVGALFIAAFFGQAAETASKRPNIVLILVDDMGFSDISCFGGSIPTPNIDAIAAEGMRFTNFYAQPVCAPTMPLIPQPTCWRKPALRSR